jgi:CHAT domain-containing protein/Flp pilus assembly protein TadD
MEKSSIALVLIGLITIAPVTISVRAIASPAIDLTQQQTSEIDQTIAEGTRLFQEGSAESVRKAIQLFEKALELSRSVKAQDKKVILLLSIAEAYNQLGEKQKALGYINQALPISRSINDRVSEARAIGNFASIYDDLGEKQKALKYYDDALLLLRALKDQAGEAIILNNIGLVYDDLGEKQKALDYYNQSLSRSRAIGYRPVEASALNGIGSIYNSFGEYQKALDHFNQSLPLSRAIGDRSMESSILNNIGNLHKSLGEYQKALEYFNPSLALNRILGEQFQEARTLNNIGSIYDKLGENQKALEHYEQSLSLSRAVSDRLGEANTLGNIGIIYYKLGENQKSLEYHNQSLLLSRAIEDRSGEASTLNNIAANLITQKQPDLAISVYKKSVNIYELLRQSIRKLPRETQEQYTSTVAITYRKLANLLLAQGRIREAQAILELLKVQESQIYGQSQESESSSIQLPFHSLETQTLQTFEKTIASRQPLTVEILKAISQPLTQNHDRITQDMQNTPIVIGNPQNILKTNPNALFIQNLVSNDNLWVIWTAPNGNTKAVLVSNFTQKQLTTTVTEFRNQVGSPNSNLSQLKANSNQLYNWLIPSELQAELTANPKQHLIFSLDHVTRYIPVAALYDGNQYIAQRYVISNLTTTDSNMTDELWSVQASSLKHDRQLPAILALGTSKGYPNFTPLPNVDAELHAIVREGNDRGLYPGKIYLNEAFTANRLRDNLDSYRILHIATHGSFNPKNITESFLLLGNGDRLPISDIANLSNLNNTHLIVLSACETGLSGAGQDGTEISGISGYFLRRGAKSVLASLWSVNDASTALLMEQFYRRLSQKQLTKAQVLQSIQQDFISGKLTDKEAQAIDRASARPYTPGQPPPESFAHPYYWAPFILVGNPQ